jgi:hypothetical protein
MIGKSVSHYKIGEKIGGEVLKIYIKNQFNALLERIS